MQRLIPTFNAKRKRSKRLTALLQPSNQETVDLPELDPEKKENNVGQNDAKHGLHPSSPKDGDLARAGAGDLPSTTMDTTMNQGIATGQKVLGMIKESTAWDVYNNEARIVDAELIKDWRDSLSTLLVFASIFAAVLTAVIIETKKLLEPDSTAIMLDVLITLTNNFANGTHNTYSQEAFTAPPEAVTVNCLLFASLGVSLTAALTSVVALQWVADYDAAIARGGGSPRDEAIRRQLLFGGILSWGMKEIIAALPLLLYCAVVLFFAGSVQWISTINPKVGQTLYGTAGIALGFYVITTFLAVVSVSAPFRTPLSQGIYRLIGYIIWLLTYLVTRKDASHLDPRRRPDAAVNKDKNLVVQALLWVGRELSLNIHAHRRFTLLVSELCKLPKEQLASPEFQEAPWPAIFEIIGVKYLSGIQNDSLDDVKDGADIAWLAEMVRIPEICAIITPKKGEENYCADDLNKEYWNQCKVSGIRLQGLGQGRPNATFLLTRDTPISSPSSMAETKAIVQMVKWRNTGCEQSLAPWLALFEEEESYSDAFFNSLVHLFTRYTASVYTDDAWQPKRPFKSRPRTKRETVAFEVISRINQGAIRRCTPGETVISLFHAFEKVVVTSDIGLILPGGIDQAQEGFLKMPKPYAKALKNADVDVLAIHDSFLALLARGIKTLIKSQPLLDTIDEISHKVKEILCMMWFRLRYEDVSRWASTNHGSESFQSLPSWVDELWSSNSVLWTDSLNSLPHAIEIIGIINDARDAIPTLGQLWLFTSQTPKAENPPGLTASFLDDWRIEIEDAWLKKQRQRAPQLIARAALQFELLLMSRGSPEDHLHVTRVLCEDLRGYSSHSSHTARDSTQVTKAIQSICDPSLCLLVNWVLDRPALLDILPTKEYLLTYKESWDMVVSYISGSFPNTSRTPRHFRASFLRFLSAQFSQQFASRAFADPFALHDLKRIFNYPLNIPTQLGYSPDPATRMDHANGTRILLYLWRVGKLRTEIVYEEMSPPLVINLSEKSVNVLLFILLQREGTGFWDVSQSCIRQIRKISHPIMEQQVPFLTLLAGLSHVASPDIYHHRPEDLAIILELLRRALLLDGETTPSFLFIDLADRLQILRQRLIQFMPGSDGRNNDEISRSLKAYVDLLRAKGRGRPLWTNAQRRLISCTLESTRSSNSTTLMPREETPMNPLPLNLTEKAEYTREIVPLFNFEWFDGGAAHQAEAEVEAGTLEPDQFRYQMYWNHAESSQSLTHEGYQSRPQELSELASSPLSASPVRSTSPSSFIPTNILSPTMGENPPWRLTSLPSRPSSVKELAISSIFTPEARHALMSISNANSEFPTNTHLYYAISRALGRGRYAFPLEIIVKIFSYAGFCKGRPNSMAVSDRPIVVNAEGGQFASEALFFYSQPLTSRFIAKMGMIKLSTLGRDQGWVSDPAQGSWSWFEIRVLTLVDDDSGGVSPKDDDVQLATNPYTPFSLQRYRIKGGSKNSGSNFKGASISHHHALAGNTPQHGIGEAFTPEGDLFNELEEGDILAVYACARFSGWQNSATQGELVVWEKFDPTSLGR